MVGLCGAQKCKEGLGAQKNYAWGLAEVCWEAWGRISNRNFTGRPASRQMRLRSKTAKDMFECIHNGVF